MDIERLNEKRFVIFDGALGTELQKRGLGIGEAPESFCLRHPDVVRKVNKSYVEAGADVILTATFGANRYKLERSGHTVDEIVRLAVDIAREAGPPFVALDVGPLGRMLEPIGDMTFEEAYDAFSEVVTAGEKYGADLIVIETMSDLYEVKAALLAAKEKTSLPVICSMSFEKDGRTFTGCGARETAVTLSSLGADAIGVNCSTGPDDLFDTVCEITRYSAVPVLVKPNAGLPDPATGAYSMSPSDFAAAMCRYAAAGVKFLGGCCGTTPDHISELKDAIKDITPEAPDVLHELVVCSHTRCAVCDRPMIIGERINPTGKRQLKEALTRGDLDYILSLAAEQTESGADILDINVGLPGIDEKDMMVKVIKAVQSVTDLPIQIDSSDPAVIEAALRVCRGRAIVNSVNGSEASLSSVLPIVKKYGAALVGLTLDDDGIPDSAEGRIRIAEKIVSRAEAIGIPARDIIIDCLTLTVSAEQKAARDTLTALKTVKERFGVKTVLGVSNISFGLPERETVNRTFLTMALEEGLDFAIINPNLPSMTSAVRAFCVLSGHDVGAADYIAMCRHRKEDAVPAVKSERTLSLERAVEGGMKSECDRLTRELLLTMTPLDVINQKLIPILDDVGERFERGELYLPQLIMASDTVGVCFAAVKEKMQKASDGAVPGDKIILATVKGDIHDIGKSIVKVLLENYGYDVIDLGRDVPPEKVLVAARDNGVMLVGLSALMTTTLGAMEETIKLVKSELPACRVMVGGAVLTEDYATTIGADYYAKDAKGAVDIAKKVFSK
ncbi:MAG: homocysteine S-methyltransferase family protein [Clostridia bacterium]|nr:homocysteine S-methyltransferase family protein [Clostridia bacterium]